MRYVLTLFALALLPVGLVTDQPAEAAQRGYPPKMPGAEVETYKTVGDAELKLFIFKPDDWQQGDERPAIVFFFGGGWTSGSPQQFLEHCKYLASRGMVAMAADYRVASRHDVRAVDCLKDAKSAVRYVRENAKRLGVDPNRIVAGGGSAGGHLAAACGTIAEFDEANEDDSISSRPNAMLLFNPAVVLAPIDEVELNDPRMEQRLNRLGAPPRELSPYHHITADVPPTAIFHGTNDKTVPIETVEVFTKAMNEAGNTCELFSYDGEGHGFFNYGRGGNKMYYATVLEADKFLNRLGYLQGEPTLEQRSE